MPTLDYYPSPRHRRRQGNTKIVMLLFGGGILWVSALFFLLPPLAALLVSHLPPPVWASASLQTMALVATILAELIMAATLIAQMQGTQVPGWVFFLPALLLIGVLLWGSN